MVLSDKSVVSLDISMNDIVLVEISQAFCGVLKLSKDCINSTSSSTEPRSPVWSGLLRDEKRQNERGTHYPSMETQYRPHPTIYAGDRSTIVCWDAEVCATIQPLQGRRSATTRERPGSVSERTALERRDPSAMDSHAQTVVDQSHLPFDDVDASRLGSLCGGVGP